MYKYQIASAMFVGVFEKKYTKLQVIATSRTVKK